MRAYFVALLLAASLAVPLPLSANAADPPPAPNGGPQTLIDIDTPNGLRIYHVMNPNGLDAEGFFEMFFAADNMQLYEANVILPNGSFRTSGWVSSNGDFVGQGDGTIYAGVGDPLFESPNLTRDDLESFGGLDLYPLGYWNVTEAWVVVYWTGFLLDPAYPDPGYALYNWTAETTVDLVYEGAVRTYEMKDFRHGARAGILTPGVVVFGGLRAHLGDYLSFPSNGGLTFGRLDYVRSPYHAKGELRLQSQDIDRTLDFHVNPDPSRGFPACFCLHVGNWYFTTENDLRASLDYIGDGRNAYATLTIAHIPGGILPAGVWKEYLIFPS